MEDSELGGPSKSPWAPPVMDNERGMRRVIQDVRRTLDDFTESYDAVIDSGTAGDRLHTEDLRQIVLGEADRLRSQYPDQGPVSVVTSMLTRVENALESRPDATQEQTSSREAERMITQLSSHAGGDVHDATAQVLNAGHVVGSAAQSLVGGSGSCAARTSIQDLIDVGGVCI